MKKTIATLAIVASGSAFAFGNDADSNVNGYVDTTNTGFGNGNAAATGKFSMTINAEGSANMDGTTSVAGDNGFYGSGYRQPYYGYAPYYAQ
jgi:hypothetical protein